VFDARDREMSGVRVAFLPRVMPAKLTHQSAVSFLRVKYYTLDAFSGAQGA
jgi:hypothetical protein